MMANSFETQQLTGDARLEQEQGSRAFVARVAVVVAPGTFAGAWPTDPADQHCDEVEVVQQLARTGILALRIHGMACHEEHE